MLDIPAPQVFRRPPPRVDQPALDTFAHIRAHGFKAAADAFAADGLPGDAVFLRSAWRVFEAGDGDVFLDVAMGNRAYRAPRQLSRRR